MKLKQILEAKYKGPLAPSDTRMPDHLRTKHGLEQHVRDWSNKLRDVVWNRWWQGSADADETELETFVMELESDPEIQRLFNEVPHRDVLPRYENAYDQIVADFQVDAMEDIEYNQHENDAYGDDEW